MHIPNLDGLTREEIQARQLKTYSRQAREVKRRRLEENTVTGEDTSSTHFDEDDELLGTSNETLKGQSDIAAKARMYREKAFR